jgi:hypothetical protein
VWAASDGGKRGGDLRGLLAGIDAVLKIAPIDGNRVDLR